ncbi:MAG TPA: radical SAM protein [Bryobacteraceae bacterium]|nr:radical SAM protein [Bryobacteraceae bacterium]
MTPVVGITLVFTRKCNASCRHCGFSCGPSATETMTVEQASAYLGEAKQAVPDLQAVSITGGEPMLFPREVVKVLALAQSLGLWSELVSNSYWAVDRIIARRRLEDFRGLGLRNFVTSLDAYHAEFVPAERVRVAVECAVDLGLQVTLKTLRPAAPGIRDSWLTGLRTTAPNLKVLDAEPLFVGRAAGSIAPGDSRAAPDASRGRCDSIIRFPAIHPNGDLYACCGFGEGARRVGSVKDTPLGALLRELRHNLLFNLLAESGPAALWEKLQEQGGVARGRSFLGACEVCNAFYFEEGPRRALREWLKRIQSAPA